MEDKYKCNLSEVEGFGRTLSEQLGSEKFVMWLDGPLGAGKTALVGAIMRGLGLDDRVPVTSPTYTIMNEYRINGKWYGHLDLYRAESDSILEEIGALDAKEYLGMFIEWPQNVGDGTDIVPTHKISIKISSHEDREYIIQDLSETDHNTSEPKV